MAEEDPRCSDDDPDLDGLRIHQIVQLKRSLWRSRSYHLAGAVACLAGCAACIRNALDLLRRHPLDGPVLAGWGLAVAISIWLAAHFYRRAECYRRQARQSDLTPPGIPPDFGPLGDGRQRWQSLMRMTEDAPRNGNRDC